ncbi:MAG TPA: outer membrane protein transport protein [Verrucomicrobiae bacterium]|nr:outer membrane protein transport protein [Verrucomicrobiae bacterium]
MNKDVQKGVAGQIYVQMLTAIILAAAAVPEAHAIGFLIPNQDAAAIARGNAFAATADNPSAIYYNPAGITQLPGTDLQVGDLNYLGLNMRFKPDAGGPSEHTRFEVLPVPQIYATKSFENIPLSLGLGVYAPFGLGVKWPDGVGPNIRDYALESKLTFITVNPVLAYKILPSLSIAAGPTINYAQLKFTRGLLSPTDFFRTVGDDFGLGATAGILWQPLEKWSFGVDYKYFPEMNFGGHSSYTPVEHTPNASVATTAKVQFPQIFSGGISFRPTPKWNIEVDVDYINWDSFNQLKLSGTSALFGSDLALQLNWKDSFQYKLGVTRLFDDGWYASAGYFYTSETTPDNLFTPAVPDTELHVGSVGFGRNCEHWHWAVAAQLIVGPQREIQSSPYAPAGKYQLISPTLSFSVGYKF